MENTWEIDVSAPKKTLARVGKTTPRIAIFGSNSVMARDFLATCEKSDFDFACFSRSNVADEDGPVHFDYSEFLRNGPYDGIINFIGIGSPRKAIQDASTLGKITRHYDSLILSYLSSHTEVPYVFVSSGSVSSLIERFGIQSRSDFENAHFAQSDAYAVAKLQTEITHREHPSLNIFDLRVFNYVSTRQSLDDGFLFTDIAAALHSKSTLITNGIDLIRDFASASELCQVLKILLSMRGNMSVDLYTKSPTSKYELLEELQRSLGLRVTIDDGFQAANPTGSKIEYTPRNLVVQDFGFRPLNTSLDNVLRTLEAFGLGVI